MEAPAAAVPLAVDGQRTIEAFHAGNLTACAAHCDKDEDCKAVTFHFDEVAANDDCWLKSDTAPGVLTEEPSSGVGWVTVVKPPAYYDWKCLNTLDCTVGLVAGVIGLGTSLIHVLFASWELFRNAFLWFVCCQCGARKGKRSWGGGHPHADREEASDVLPLNQQVSVRDE